MDPRIALVGLVVGVLVGISGVGGSSLVTPLLILVMRVQPLVAIGTDLAYSVPTKLVGALIHGQQGTINRRLVGYLALGGLPGAVLGLIVLWVMRASLPLATISAILQRAVGGLLILVAVLVVLLPLLTRRREVTASKGEQDLRRPTTAARIIALGLVVGFGVSLTSIGSGSITLPMLYMFLPAFGLRQLIGADVAFAALLVPVAALGHWQLGGVNFALAGNLLIGSLPGVVIGSKLCRYLPELLLRPALAGVLLFAASRLVLV